MRTWLLAFVATPLMIGPALAGGTSARAISIAGQPPEVVQREPDPHALMRPFKVFYVDDGSCPPGQIKRFTRGSDHFQVPSRRECIPR